jgi:hypothetical protein
MRRSAKDLSSAVKMADPEGVKKAGTELYGSCTDYHGDFRE